MKREDLVAKLLPLFLRTVPLETVKFTFNRHAAARISVVDDKINIDQLEPQGVVFDIHSPSKISNEKLNQTNVTISFFRKGRKVYSSIMSRGNVIKLDHMIQDPEINSLRAAWQFINNLKTK